MFQHLFDEIPKQVRDDNGVVRNDSLYRGCCKRRKGKEMRYLMFLLGLLFANVAQAMDCEKVPDCASLGYSTKDDPNCADNGYMYCPFDKTYKKCVQYNCEALGFTESDKTSWCADLIECKGNAKMTLCQKPCFAIDYNSLKELAESGDCKVVTMRDDIIIPQNQGIKFAPNTILDGGNHTLTSTGNQAYNLYYFAENTGFKNINIVHTQDLLENFHFYIAPSQNTAITFENVNIKLTSTDTKHAINNYMFFRGTFNITGKFVVYDQSAAQVAVLGYETIKHFKDADIHILTTYQTSDVFSLGTLTMENSTVDVQSGATVFISAGSGIASFKNTKGTFHSNKSGVIYGTQGLPRLVIQEGCDITLSATTQLTNVDVEQTIELSGTPENPTKLSIRDKAKKFRNLSVQAHDLNVSLVINGTTYKPIKPTTTLLKDVETSQDWEVVSPTS